MYQAVIKNIRIHSFVEIPPSVPTQEQLNGKFLYAELPDGVPEPDPKVWYEDKPAAPAPSGPAEAPKAEAKPEPETPVATKVPPPPTRQNRFDRPMSARLKVREAGGTKMFMERLAETAPPEYREKVRAGRAAAQEPALIENTPEALRAAQDAQHARRRPPGPPPVPRKAEQKEEEKEEEKERKEDKESKKDSFARRMKLTFASGKSPFGFGR